MRIVLIATVGLLLVAVLIRRVSDCDCSKEAVHVSLILDELADRLQDEQDVDTAVRNIRDKSQSLRRDQVGQ